MEVITVQINLTHTHTQSGKKVIHWNINKALKATTSFIMSICLPICRKNAASTEWIIVQLDTVSSNQTSVKIKKFWFKSDKNNRHFTHRPT